MTAIPHEELARGLHNELKEASRWHVDKPIFIAWTVRQVHQGNMIVCGRIHAQADKGGTLCGLKVYMGGNMWEFDMQEESFVSCPRCKAKLKKMKKAQEEIPNDPQN